LNGVLKNNKKKFHMSGAALPLPASGYATAESRVYRWQCSCIYQCDTALKWSSRCFVHDCRSLKNRQTTASAPRVYYATAARHAILGCHYKKLSYRRVTARCVLSVVILPITTQQYRNYLYDKS